MQCLKALEFVLQLLSSAVIIGSITMKHVKAKCLCKLWWVARFMRHSLVGQRAVKYTFLKFARKEDGKSNKLDELAFAGQVAKIGLPSQVARDMHNFV